MSDKDFGQRLRELREARGWSQGQLAERAKLTRPYISLVEKGERKPKRETLELLALAFGMTIEEMEGREALIASNDELQGVQVNLLKIGELSREDYEEIIRQIQRRREILERMREEDLHARRRKLSSSE